MKILFLTRPLIIAGALALSGCAGAKTSAGSISPEELRAEQLKQQTLALQSEIAQQARLDNVAYPLLRSSTQLCGNSVAYRAGFRALNVASYTKDWVTAARAIGMTDTLRVVIVTRGSTADRAGLRAGDRIVQIAGRPAPIGKSAVRDFADYLEKVPHNENAFISLTVLGDTASTTRAIAIPQEEICSYGAILARDDALNAWADGQNVFVTSAMLRFASTDEELSIVLGHELAHNAMNHIGARKRNSTIGAILGAAVDVAAAANGVSTQGTASSIGSQAGSRAYSQEFEREADYVGMYFLARAGVPYENSANFWRRMAEEKPGSISFAETHPTTAERFIRLDQAALEIDKKKSAGQTLLPNKK